MLHRLLNSWLPIVMGSLFIQSAYAVELTGEGSYLADQSILAEDAYRFARNRALANASEKAALLIESNKQLVKSDQQQWTRQEIHQLSASLLRITHQARSQMQTANGTRYDVQIVADFDDAQQTTLQNYLADNQELREQLQRLATEQTNLQASVEQTQQIRQQTAQKQQIIINRENPSIMINRYEQKLNDTRSWLNAQQRQHLDIALQTVEMRQAIALQQKSLQQARQRMSEELASVQKAAIEEDAKRLANIRYIAAQRIVRFVREHMPLTTDQIDIQPINDTLVNLHYQLHWQMSTPDLERLCQLFYEGQLADQCGISDDNSQVIVKTKPDLLTGLFLPFSTHANVWQNPSLALFTPHEKAPKPETFSLNKNGTIRIRVANTLSMTLKTATTQARTTMASGQDLIGGTWQ